MQSSLAAYMTVSILGTMPGEPRRTELQTTELDDIDTLVHTYRPRLLRFAAFSIGDPDLAESIVQDCFLKAYRTRASFRGDCSAYTWLRSIANNLIRDYQRTEKFRFWRKARATAVDVSTMASVLASSASSQEARLLAEERAVQVAAIIETLSPNQRRVFLMRFLEEMSIQEICQATGIRMATVKTHIHRAVKLVRQKVGEVR
jgi:RNA polymerase sigma-70 factor (ECF subfamily)